MGVLVSLLILGILVVVHEYGHFLVARWSGVRILRFSVGFGPRLWARTRGDTEYALSAIPLGGYVKMAGEQRSEEPPKPGDYLATSIGARARIIFAGPFVNYLVAYLSLWMVFTIGYPELLPVVGTVMDDTPAQAAGLQTGDRIQSVDEQETRTWDELLRAISGAPGQSLTLQIERDDVLRTVTVTPESEQALDPLGDSQTVGRIGITPSGAFASYRVGPIAAIGRAFRQQHEWTVLTLRAVWSLLTGKLKLRESVTGPIGLVVLTSEAMRMGLAPVLFLTSLFSLSLAIFNLFPIPILDGGHLFFLLLEKLRGRPVSVTIQERASQVSFVLLMTLVVFICINDVNRFGLLDKVTGWFTR